MIVDNNKKTFGNNQEIEKKIQKKLTLYINVDEVNKENDVQPSPSWGSDCTYRLDDVSIGRDFLRIAGRTISRGHLLSSVVEIKDIIGRGSFSTVRRGLWKTQGHSGSVNDIKEVAVKEFYVNDLNENMKRVLIRELRTLCTFDSSSLLKLHGAFLCVDRVTMILDYMSGGSLTNLMTAIRSQHETNSQKYLFPENLVAAISYQILSGLEYLHGPERRIIHRDVKPDNVLFDPDNGSIKLCDFGLASSLGDNSLSTTLVGTTFYMSPERLRAKAYGRASDIWSFGLIARECIVGDLPWKDVSSIVDLLVTIEETSLASLIPNEMFMSKAMKEILLGSLQYNPGRYK
jgi:serine/threonine protein kinase